MRLRRRQRDTALTRHQGLQRVIDSLVNKQKSDREVREHQPHGDVERRERPRSRLGPSGVQRNATVRPAVPAVATMARTSLSASRSV